MPSKVWEKKLLVLVADLLRDIDAAGSQGFQARFNQSPESVMDEYGVPEEGRVLLFRSAEDLQQNKHRGALAWSLGGVARRVCADAALKRCSSSTAAGSRNLIDLIADMLRKDWLIAAYNYNNDQDYVLGVEDVRGAAREALTYDDNHRCQEVGNRVAWEVLNYSFGSAPEVQWPLQYPAPCTPVMNVPSGAPTVDVLFWSDPGACVRDVNIQSTSLAQAPNNSSVTLEVRGEGFRKNATMALRIDNQAAVIPGESVVVFGTYRRSKLTAEVDLRDALPGCYEVIVENAGLKLGSGVYFLVVGA